MWVCKAAHSVCHSPAHLAPLSSHHFETYLVLAEQLGQGG